MPELLEKLPHDLAPREEDPDGTPAIPSSGPKKPALVNAFTAMGYDCHGGVGTFILRRRTPGNLTVELELDVGTWSNAIMVFFRVQGLIDGQGFKALINLPVARRAAGDRPWGRACGSVSDRWPRTVASDRRQSGGSRGRTGPWLCARDRGGVRPLTGMVSAEQPLTAFCLICSAQWSSARVRSIQSVESTILGFTTPDIAASSSVILKGLQMRGRSAYSTGSVFAP
jgi:hypothetical protein